MSEGQQAPAVPGITYVLPGRWISGASIPEGFASTVVENADDPQVHVCVELERGEATPMVMLTMWPRVPVGMGAAPDLGAGDLARDLAAADRVEVVEGLNPKHGVVRGSRLEVGADGTKTLVVTYWLTRPRSTRVLLVAFLTPLTEIENAVLGFTDAIVRTFRWGDDEDGKNEGGA
jgi:hypothetical protein